MKKKLYERFDESLDKLIDKYLLAGIDIQELMIILERSSLEDFHRRLVELRKGAK